MRQLLEDLNPPSDGYEEVVCEGLVCYVGHRPVSRRTVQRLLRLMALKDVSCGEKMQRFCINETGQALLARPELEDELQRAIIGGKPFTLNSGHIVFMDADE